MSLDLSAELVKMLDDRAIDSLCEVGVVVCDRSRSVADLKEDVLETAVAHELGALLERNLNNTAELS